MPSQRYSIIYMYVHVHVHVHTCTYVTKLIFKLLSSSDLGNQVIVRSWTTRYFSQQLPAHFGAATFITTVHDTYMNTVM